MSVSFVVQFHPDSIYLHGRSKNLGLEHFAPINSKLRHLPPPSQRAFDRRLFPWDWGMRTLRGWGRTFDICCVPTLRKSPMEPPQEDDSLRSRDQYQNILSFALSKAKVPLGQYSRVSLP